MKRFRFPLRPVAVLRAHRELKAREAFAASVNVYVDSERALAAVRERMTQFETALFAGRRASFNAAGEAASLAAYRRECAAEGEAERAMTTARGTMDERRAEYLEAHRKLEVVKRLETKARTDHRVEAQREEQANYDDFAGRLVSRRALAAAASSP